MCKTTSKRNAELVTVGLPFYNADKYIDYAIKSVISQSYDNWELILMDDGSTDRSVEIAKKYLSDSRIKLITDGENRGLPFRLNQQIALANGKYFARMDADDIMHPERIERQVQYLEINEHIDVVGTYAYSIDSKNNVCGLLKTSTVFPNTLNDVFTYRCLIHVSVMAKLNWYKSNLYDKEEIRVEDIGLWARTIMTYKFANLDIPLMFVRDVVAGSSVLKKYLLSMKGLRKIIRKYFSKFSSPLKWKLMLETYLKSFVYIVFCTLHKEDILIRRRSLFISDNEVQNGSEILKKLVQNAK